MRSPILVLQDAIAASAFKIAPERAQSLSELEGLKNFSLVFTDEKEFSIRVNTKTHEAKLPIASLEYMWCSAYFFYTLYQEYLVAQKSNNTTIDTAKNTKTASAINALNWAVNNMEQSGIEQWPDEFPKPEQSPVRESDVDVANELFLSAIAWIIHHEIQHVLLKHQIAHAAFTIQQEKQADLAATDWVLSHSTQPLEFQKRVMGVITAILSMQFLDKPSGAGDYIGTHPPSLERLDYILTEANVYDDSVVCAFAICALQFHAGQYGILADLDGSSMRDILSGFMVAFSTHNRTIP